jgi:glycogen debranching enzyme
MLKRTMNHIRDEYGLLGIVDIVLNHTASNSAWLLDHPESAYNTDDCPWLYSAWLFDKALADFSDNFAQRKNVSECPSAPYISNEIDLNAVINAIQNRVINVLNLHEFFMIDVEKAIQGVRDTLKQELLDGSKGRALIDKYRVKFDKRKWWTKD